MTFWQSTTDSAAALGSPVGRPPFKVAPYGAKGDVNGAWEEEADEETKELDEDFAPLVSPSKSQPSSMS